MRVPNLENMIQDHMAVDKSFRYQRVKILSLLWYRFDKLKNDYKESLTSVSTLRSMIQASFDESITHKYIWGNTIHKEIMHRYRTKIPNYRYGDHLNIRSVMDSILLAQADANDDLPY